MAYYMDLFNGDPTEFGTSVLSAITGSTVRQDVTSALVQTTAGFFPFQKVRLTNTDTVTVVSASANSSNISYVALYDAPSGGTLLTRTALGAAPTIAKGNPVQFSALNLTFMTPFVEEMVNETEVAMTTETGVIMVVQ